MVLRLSLLALGLAAAGCDRVCPEQQPLADGDGGVQRCVVATDCTGPSGVLICSSTDDQSRDCVGCVETNCVRFVPKACP